MAELNVPARVDNLDEVIDFVNRQLDETDCSMKVQVQIDVAVEEIFVNIASYAYAPGEGGACIRFEADREKNEALITFIDGGVPYDPLAKPDPDVTLSAEKRQIGGLGIYMVKKSMDGMTYRYEDGKNILTIMKKL
ncbi:MAG: ATP-binding protein [Oscillospiraceae bacterium]|nr:ATP-binding protein [Oscillospiraceae bacterium]